jgi:hypothetical protein
MTDNQLEFHLPAPPVSGDTPLIPARMVNEFVYCPRLAYLMWTQGEWAETGDTVRAIAFTRGSIVPVHRFLRPRHWKPAKPWRATRLSADR